MHTGMLDLFRQHTSACATLHQHTRAVACVGIRELTGMLDFALPTTEKGYCNLQDSPPTVSVPLQLRVIALNGADEQSVLCDDVPVTPPTPSLPLQKLRRLMFRTSTH